jgi:PEP-CTERM motif
MKVVSLGAALLVFCLFLPGSATATNNVDFSNREGTLFGTMASLGLSQPRLISMIAFNGDGLTNGNHRPVSLSTGSMASRFDVLFSGTFSGPVTRTLITLANGSHNYTVTGVVVGSTVGQLVSAVTLQSTINIATEFFQNSTLMAVGDTRIVSSIPEPSTLALLFTGSVGTLGMMWRKLLAS